MPNGDEENLAVNVALERARKAHLSVVIEKMLEDFIEYQGCVEAGHSITYCRKKYIGKILSIKDELDEIIDWPGPRPGPYLMGLSVLDERTVEVNANIFGDAKRTMIFSKKISEAFEETGINLKEGETFACNLSIIKTPGYASEVLNSTGGKPQLSCIIHPRIMSKVMDVVERDRINI